MPHLVEMADKFSPDEFAMLGVETTNRPEMARAYVDSIGAKWPQVLDAEKTASELFAIRGVPTTLFIDPQGRILFRMVGFRPGDELAIEETVGAMIERMKSNS